MKTTKLFQHRKRSDHKLWKRKRVFLRLQNNLEKLFHAFNYNQALINGTREGFFSHGTIRCETQKQTEWWKCALIVMRQYCKHHWKTVDNLINNLLTNCAGTNSTNFTMILSFYRSKSHSCQNPKKNRFYRVSFLNYPKPGFNILPRIGNTSWTGLCLLNFQIEHVFSRALSLGFRKPHSDIFRMFDEPFLNIWE